MEKLAFDFPAGPPAANRCVVGVVGSGDLEVLLEPNVPGATTIAVTTSVDGYARTWEALLRRVFTAGALPAVRIEINDFGATPGVVRMRIEQALEASADAGDE
jgi:malonate decarboxylase delta subunit